jgi:hypothetical protein
MALTVVTATANGAALTTDNFTQATLTTGLKVLAQLT